MSTPTPTVWTYGGDPANSQLDEFRFLLGDVDSALPLLSDQEVNYILTIWLPRYGSVTYAASVGADVISRKFAGVVTVNADGVTVNVSDLSDKYAKAAISLRGEHERGAETEGDIDLANLMLGSELEPGIAPLEFGIGIFDNPEAGQQAYGGTLLVPVIEWAR